MPRQQRKHTAADDAKYHAALSRQLNSLSRLLQSACNASNTFNTSFALKFPGRNKQALQQAYQAACVNFYNHYDQVKKKYPDFFTDDNDDSIMIDTLIKKMDAKQAAALVASLNEWAAVEQAFSKAHQARIQLEEKETQSSQRDAVTNKHSNARRKEGSPETGESQVLQVIQKDSKHLTGYSNKMKQSARNTTNRKRTIIGTLIGLFAVGSWIVGQELFDPVRRIEPFAHKIDLQSLSESCESATQHVVDAISPMDDPISAYRLMPPLTAELVQQSFYPDLLDGRAKLCAAQLLVLSDQSDSGCGNEAVSLHLGVVGAADNCQDHFPNTEEAVIKGLACLIQALRGVPPDAPAHIADQRVTINRLDHKCGLVGAHGWQRTHFVFEPGSAPFRCAEYTISNDKQHETYRFEPT